MSKFRLHGHCHDAQRWWGICRRRSEILPNLTHSGIIERGYLLDNNRISHTHTPSDASSYLDITLTALWRLLSSGGSSDGGWRISIFVDNASQGDCVLTSLGTLQSGNASPCFGRYTNSSLSSKTISIRAIQLYPNSNSRYFLNFNNYGLQPNWLSIEEVKR